MNLQVYFKLKLAAIIILIYTSSYSQKTYNKTPRIINIEEALEKKLLKLKITGAADSRLYHETIDGDGNHFGKCMVLELRSETDSFLIVKMTRGTELIPLDTIFQTMIVTKTVKLPLFPNSTYATRIYAMCGQIHDNAPYFESIYNVGGLSDSNTVKLATYFDENYIQNMIGQHALWAYKDGVEFKDLIKYGADSLTIEKTKEILNNLNIQTKLVHKKIKIEKTETPTDKNIIQINRYYIYVGTGIILLLLITSIKLFVKRRNNDPKTST